MFTPRICGAEKRALHYLFYAFAVLSNLAGAMNAVVYGLTDGVRAVLAEKVIHKCNII